MDIVDLSKKRKLQADQSGLPLPKHKRWDNNLLSNNFSELDANYEKHDDGSEVESGNGSNSFVGDYIPFCGEYPRREAGDSSTRKEVEKAKLCSYNRPSSSSYSLDSYSFNESVEISSAENVIAEENEFTSMAGVQLDSTSLSGHGKEPLGDRMYADYFCAEYGIEGMEHFSEKELQVILKSNNVDPNAYVLSSGRWSANQDTQQKTKRPTIDQEFEEYFSALML